MINLRFYQIIEYVVIIGIIASSIIVVTLNEIVYIFIPISLSIILNLINRYKLYQQIQRKSIELQKPLLDKLESVNDNYQETQNKLNQLLTKIENTPLENKKNINSDSISDLQVQCKHLQESIDGLIYRMLCDGVISSHNSKSIDKAIETIIIQYQQEKANRKQSYDNISDDDFLRQALKPHKKEDE